MSWLPKIVTQQKENIMPSCWKHYLHRNCRYVTNVIIFGYEGTAYIGIFSALNNCTEQLHHGKYLIFPLANSALEIHNASMIPRCFTWDFLLPHYSPRSIRWVVGSIWTVKQKTYPILLQCLAGSFSDFLLWPNNHHSTRWYNQLQKQPTMIYQVLSLPILDTLQKNKFFAG